MTDEEYIERLEYCQFPMTCCICQYKDSCELDNSKTVDLIHRMQEENKRLNNAIKNFQRCIDNGEFVSKDMFDRQKAEIERLRKQADELKEERDVFKRLFESANTSHFSTNSIIETMNSFYREQAEHLAGLKIEQAVKDTAKEILAKAPNETNADETFIFWIRERYDVEVE